MGIPGNRLRDDGQAGNLLWNECSGIDARIRKGGEAGLGIGWSLTQVLANSQGSEPRVTLQTCSFWASGARPLYFCVDQSLDVGCSERENTAGVLPNKG